MPRHRDDWFKAAYPDFLEPLCKYLRRFVSPETAEDLAHEAFLRVYTAPDFDGIRSPRGYLFRTARNLALNAASEHGTSRTEAVEEVANFVDERASVERQAMTDEEFDLLCIAIAQLTPKRQKVLILRTFYEYSTQQIADKLDISIRTVHRDLARALEAVHAARAAVEADRSSLFARLIRGRRRGRRGR
ncbi:MAG TPA: sigma-70 family RNA polymerase sigma factor [Rhodothermales bacterium]|nr:sigma-70 family RNA polymerase sigma factor [Rhodothermales bacterium]